MTEIRQPEKARWPAILWWNHRPEKLPASICRLLFGAIAGREAAGQYMATVCAGNAGLNDLLAPALRCFVVQSPA